MARGGRARDPGPMDTQQHHMNTDTTAAPRRMKRSREDRMLGGVCGGIAAHFGIDPVIVRVATVALIFAGGIGIAPYLAAWVLMPLEESRATAAPAPAPA
jgi:phage shock protein C